MPAAASGPGAAALEDRAVELAWKEAKALRTHDEAEVALRFVTNLNAKFKLERALAPDPLVGWRDLGVNREYRSNTLKLFESALQDKRIRIIGGEETLEFPDCVAVGSEEEWCCSGTLVARNVVVTAAHCVPRCAARVFFGFDVTGQGQVIRVSHAETRQGADLAVLVLAEDAPVAARRMQSAKSSEVPPWVRIAGFGDTDEAGRTGYGRKRRVDVPVKTWSCGPSEQPLYGCQADGEFVAAPPVLAEPADSCTGDSGGPAYALIGSEWVLCGAVSRATRNSTRACGDGGVYVKIQYHEEWIRSVKGGRW